MSEELNGTYLANATDVQFGFSSKGTEQLGVAFKLEDGRHVTSFLYFSDAAADRSIEALRTMGWTGDDLSTLTAADLPNQVSLVIEQEEYNGKRSPRVKWINRAGGLNMVDPMDERRKREFAARMRSRARSVPAGRQSQNTGRPAGRQPGEDDADLPF